MQTVSAAAVPAERQPSGEIETAQSLVGHGITSSNLRRLVATIAADAGIERTVTPYDLRHSATSLLGDAGHSADRLADLLGHKDTRMVWKHYRHVISESVDVAADYWRDTGTD